MPTFPQLGSLQEIWRFPVKSMRGESLSAVDLLPQGLAGDRAFALGSTAAPRGKPLLASTERTAALRYRAAGEAATTVTTPSQQSFPLHSPALLAAFERELASPGARLTLHHAPNAPFFDVRPVSLVSQATLHALAAEFGAPVDPLRFRSNLVLAFDGNEPFAEDRLVGSTLQFGSPDDPIRPRLHILERIPRCRIVSLDPETTAADPSLLRHLARFHEGRLGIYARVLTPGRLCLGQVVSQHPL